MSDIIQLLPASVANQIAAGEVIQRPASVIKELVENSLDAGASRIQVIVTDAGKTCIQVIDNGKGMSETDARMAFERHATSKIRQANDLFALTTMGFRGEALASIAAVAEVELRTRQADEELGISVNIAASHVVSSESISCPVGANFIVKNLFYNIPARRRFLKSDKTELTNILTEFQRIALAHPEISFSLSTSETLLMDLPAGSFRQRINNVFNRQSLDHALLSVQVDTPIVQIAGFVGNPESSKRKNVPQFFFVNGRYMRHPFFAKAVQTAYERLIADGEQTPFFLQLIVDPSKIDVNIHPTKTEIKFEDERSIWQILLAAVREALGKFNAIPTIDFDTENRPDIPLFEGGSTNVQPPQIRINPSFNPFDNSASSAAVPSATSSAAVPHTHRYPNTGTSLRPPYTFVDDVLIPNDGPDLFGAPSKAEAKEATHGADSQTFGDAPTQPSSSIAEGISENMQATVGVSLDDRMVWDPATSDYLLYHGQYMLTPADDGLLVIDAHRAHVRILYEEYKTLTAERPLDSQRLLFPQLVTLDATQSALLDSMIDDLETLGIVLSTLGGGTYSILAVPTQLEGSDPQQLLQTIIDDASENAHDTREQLQHSAAIALARRSAIAVGQHLSNDEMRSLAARLFATTNPNYTPDGKPILHVVAHNTLLAKG